MAVAFLSDPVCCYITLPQREINSLADTFVHAAAVPLRDGRNPLGLFGRAKLTPNALLP